MSISETVYYKNHLPALRSINTAFACVTGQSDAQICVLWTTGNLADAGKILGQDARLLIASITDVNTSGAAHRPAPIKARRSF